MSVHCQVRVESCRGNVTVDLTDSAIVPLYNGETAPKAIRGTILVIYQVQIISGFATISQISRIRALNVTC